MLQRKITIRKTKFGQKCLRGRRDATEQQREIFGICRRQAPSPLLKAIARMAPPTGEGIAGTAVLERGGCSISPPPHGVLRSARAAL